MLLNILQIILKLLIVLKKLSILKKDGVITYKKKLVQINGFNKAII